MEIIIEGPSFYAQEDEDLFFSGIYGLPGFEQVRGQGTQLKIEIAEPVKDEAIVKLVVLCRRWSIDVAPLLNFRRESNQALLLWDQEL